MKNVGIITFHAAHNYGAVLQAYALQQTVLRMGMRCEIINLRTDTQKKQYALFENNSSLIKLAKNIYTLCEYRNYKSKFDKFEDFIEHYLKKSKCEYKSLKEMENAVPYYDYYISGSDQIWNVNLGDFDMSYFLPFVRTGRKIAYAPSCGQSSDISKYPKIKEYVNDYDYLSVRDENSRKVISRLTDRNIEILPDPVLLPDIKAWEQITPEASVKKDYIFFYTLSPSRETIQMAKRISDAAGLEVIIPRKYFYSKFSGFKVKADIGPLDFLSLIKNAKLVLTSSFHATVFSILFHTPFLALNGMQDNRISTLLKMTLLTNRAVT